MGEGLKKLRQGAGTTEGNRWPTGVAPAVGVTTEGWLRGSAGAWPERKREVVLRLFSRRIRGNYLAETGALLENLGVLK